MLWANKKGAVPGCRVLTGICLTGSVRQELMDTAAGNRKSGPGRKEENVYEKNYSLPGCT